MKTVPSPTAATARPHRLIFSLFFLAGILPFTAAWPYSPYVSWVAESVAVLIALAICAVTFRATRASTTIRLSPMALTFLVFGALIAIGAAVTQPPYLTVVYVAAYFLAACVLLSVAIGRWNAEGVDVFEPFIRGLFVCSWIQMVFVILQMTGGIAVYSQWMSSVSLWFPHYFPGPIATGLLFQRNNLVDFLFVCMLATAHLYNTGRIHKYLYFFWIAFAGFVFTLTSSRSTFMFAGVVVLLALFARRKAEDDESRRFAKIVLISAIVLVAIQAVLIPLGPHIEKLMLQAPMDSGLSRLNRESFLGIRLRLWEKALVMVNEHPWFGVGLGGYGAEAVRLHTRWGFDPKMQDGAFFTNAHNLFMHLLAETGILATLAILIGGGFIAWSLVKGKWTSKRLIACAGAAVIFMHSQVEYPLWYAYFILLFAALISLQDTKWLALKVRPRLFTWSAQVVIVLMVAACVISFKWYASLVPIANAPLSNPVTPWEMETLADISHQPITAEMADFFLLLRMMDTSDRDLSAKLAFTQRLADFRPNDFILFRRALYLSYAGRHEEALECIKRAYYNNRDSIRAMIGYFNEVHADPRLVQVRQRLLMYYQDYQKLSPGN